ncbi:biotin--[acetyl-CoA-carboxylase] ligase [Legionella sp. W05-934-2]|uniref:biotin--[acetyl-CoA-carboxylase] ligase n=1 Tax=Legionella sp. W05-934-2 TaxID=1198649 RepID=UPI0034632D39
MTYPSPYQLLNYLSHDCWVSGPNLADKMGLSRTAIWKQVKKLQSNGVAIENSHHGYRLSDSLILLNQSSIDSGIDAEWHEQGIELLVLPTIDSTNTYVKRHVKTKPWTVCVSEQQTAGRGRLGRSWASPFGENMYLSIAWRTTVSLAKLSGLSLAASLALRNALRPWIDNLKVKWPNDLFWQGKKVAGCLVEVTAESHGNSLIVVGLGLNINTQTRDRPLSHLPHCSLRDIVKRSVNRNEIIVATINHCLHAFKQFEFQGLTPLQNTWKEADYLYNQPITIYQSQKQIQGIAKGINDLGHLLVEQENGLIEEISSGDATLNHPS